MDDLLNGSKPSRRSFIAGAGTTVAAVTMLAGVDPSAGTAQSGGASPAQCEPQSPAEPDQYGPAGEVHEVAGGKHPNMTTNQGLVIADDENQLKVGARGLPSYRCGGEVDVCQVPLAAQAGAPVCDLG